MRRSTRLAALPATALKNAPSLEPPSGRKRKSPPDDAALAVKTKAPSKRTSKPIEPAPTAAMPDNTDSPVTPRKPRLANPLATNAPLISPQTSRIITSVAVDDLSPSKQAAPGITTATVLDEACAHLITVDARMAPLIQKHRCKILTAEGLAEEIDPFESLTSGILSQQVSGAAARSIKNKFIALFNADDRFPTPAEVAPLSIEKLRTAGLSQRKAEYIQGLAQKFASGELSAEMLFRADYDEVLEKLVAVRGLGKWSVEMFAFFGLKRMDIFSTGDLGVQRGMAAFVGRDVAKLKSKGGKWKYMSEQEMLDISARFAPYRSLFMWYMWKVEEVDVSSME